MQKVRPISEQCRELNIPIPIGATARELRDRKFEVHPEVPDYAVLAVQDRPDEDISARWVTTGKPTGYIWRWGLQGELALAW